MGSVNSGGNFSGIGQKRGFAEIADETSLMSAAKRVAAKSCLPQMHKISEGPSTHLNQATHARKVVTPRFTVSQRSETCQQQGQVRNEGRQKQQKEVLVYLFFYRRRRGHGHLFRQLALSSFVLFPHCEYPQTKKFRSG